MGTWSTQHVNSRNPTSTTETSARRNYVAAAAKGKAGLDKNVPEYSMTDQSVLYMGPMKEKWLIQVLTSFHRQSLRLQHLSSIDMIYHI